MALKHNIACPKTYIVENEDHFEEAIANLDFLVSSSQFLAMNSEKILTKKLS
nr:hypothetical protein [Priestia megaterium]